MNNSESTKTKQPDRPEQYINWLIGKIKGKQADKGLAARLRRADNPATEYQSWEVLAGFGIDLSRDWERLPYAAISAALARSDQQVSGQISLGQALAACYPDGADSEPAKARLRRLLACRSVEELCRVLRPMLSLIDSKGGAPLDYAALLRQTLRFGHGDEAAQQIKAQWAQDFYRRQQTAVQSGAGSEQVTA